MKITPCTALVVGYAWFVVLVLLPLSIAFPPFALLIPALPTIYLVRRANQRAARAAEARQYGLWLERQL